MFTEYSGDSQVNKNLIMTDLFVYESHATLY